MSKTATINWPAPCDGEIWLEYGWVKGNEQDLVWYNEGQADEFGVWYRALLSKVRTDAPAGPMYFTMGVYDNDSGTPRHDLVIVVGQTDENSADRAGYALQIVERRSPWLSIMYVLIFLLGVAAGLFAQIYF